MCSICHNVRIVHLEGKEDGGGGNVKVGGGAVLGRAFSTQRVHVQRYITTVTKNGIGRSSATIFVPATPNFVMVHDSELSRGAASFLGLVGPYPHNDPREIDKTSSPNKTFNEWDGMPPCSAIQRSGKRINAK